MTVTITTEIVKTITKSKNTQKDISKTTRSRVLRNDRTFRLTKVFRFLFYLERYPQKILNVENLGWMMIL
jgi:hypothetical protein